MDSSFKLKEVSRSVEEVSRSGQGENRLRGILFPQDFFKQFDHLSSVVFYPKI
jgi:hypothetical protein